MKQTFHAWVMRDEEVLDEDYYLAFCEEVPAAGGHGRSPQQALDDLAANVELWLDSYRDHLRADLMPGAERAAVSVSRTEANHSCHHVEPKRIDQVNRVRTPRGAFTAIIEPAQNMLLARCPEVPGANGQGRTRKKVLANLADAIDLMLLERRVEDLRQLSPDTEVATVIVK
jgi:predicted RNase H-like HicB family nuclease